MNDVAYHFGRGHRALNSPARVESGAESVTVEQVRTNFVLASKDTIKSTAASSLSRERETSLEIPSLFSAYDTLSPYREMVHTGHFSRARYRLGLYERNFTAAIGADAVI